MKSKGNPGAKSAGAPSIQREAGNFSRVLAVDDIPEDGLEISIRADAAECAALAKADGLEAILCLEADLQIVKQGRGGAAVKGVLRARVVQTCVVSLDLFESEVQAGVDARFAPSHDIAPAPARSVWDIETGADSMAAFPPQAEPPDPIVDGRIDLGALVEEFLVLNLDPYPRKPGACFDEDDRSGEPVEKVSPFAVLKKLKDGG